MSQHWNHITLPNRTKSAARCWPIWLHGLLLVGVLFSLLPVTLRSAKAAPIGDGGYVPGELLVRFQPGVTPTTSNGQVEVGAAALDTLFQRYEVSAAEQLFPGIDRSTTGLERIYKLTVAPETDLLDLLAALNADNSIDYAEPNYLYHTQEWAEGTDLATTSAAARPAPLAQSGPTPSDTLYGYQWALNNPRTAGSTARIDIHAPEAWAMTTGAPDLLIAIIDSGIDYTHEDLNDGRVRTDIDKDYVNKDDDALDDNGHGTHVAGTIAAAGNNAIGISGILWQAQLLPLKVCDEGGSCSIDAISSAIHYAADQGARVINMSLGSSSCSETLEAAIDYAYFEKGVVVVAAAGNDNNLVGYPAAYEPVLAVGALDRHGKRAYFSSYGEALDLVAPGVRIFSTVPNNGYETFSGTSMASPHVAGVAGLLLAQRPTLTNHEVRAILTASADDLGEVGRDRQYGYGLVDAVRALESATPVAAPVPGYSRCSDVECGAAAALSGQPDEGELLTTLRTARDQLFTQAPGLAWREVYYRHQSEVFWLVMGDANLRADARTAIRSLHPALQSLLSENQSPTIVTAEMVADADKVISALVEQGSPELRSDLAREWGRLDATRFVGSTTTAAWQTLQTEGVEQELYLPFVRH